MTSSVASWTGFHASRAASATVTSSAPPAPGLSPESEMKKGLGPSSAAARHSSMEATGATNSKRSCTSQKYWPMRSACSLTSSASSPVTTTAPLQRGWSAHAKPIQIAASRMPSIASMGSIILYRDLAGSMRVEVFSPGSRTGTWTRALTGLGWPFRRRMPRL